MPEGFMFFGQPPEQVQEMIDRQEMSHDELMHSFRRLIEELNEDQLHVLSTMLNVAGQNQWFSHYYSGIISGILHAKFGVCAACGKKHDQELAEMAPAPEQKRSAKEIAQLMDEYNVHYTGSYLEVECNNCGKKYVSLDDRMLRSPDPSGCSGCVEKTKWG